MNWKAIVSFTVARINWTFVTVTRCGISGWAGSATMSRPERGSGLVLVTWSKCTQTAYIVCLCSVIVLMNWPFILCLAGTNEQYLLKTYCHTRTTDTYIAVICTCTRILSRYMCMQYAFLASFAATSRMFSSAFHQLNLSRSTICHFPPVSVLKATGCSTRTQVCYGCSSACCSK